MGKGYKIYINNVFDYGLYYENFIKTKTLNFVKEWQINNNVKKMSNVVIKKENIKQEPLISFISDEPKFEVGEKCRFKMYRDDVMHNISNEEWKQLTKGNDFLWHNAVIDVICYNTHLRDYTITLCDSPEGLDMNCHEIMKV